MVTQEFKYKNSFQNHEKFLILCFISCLIARIQSSHCDYVVSIIFKEKDQALLLSLKEGCNTRIDFSIFVVGFFCLEVGAKGQEMERS